MSSFGLRILLTTLTKSWATLSFSGSTCCLITRACSREDSQKTGNVENNGWQKRANLIFRNCCKSLVNNKTIYSSTAATNIVMLTDYYYCIFLPFCYRWDSCPSCKLQCERIQCQPQTSNAIEGIYTLLEGVHPEWALITQRMPLS